ADEVVCPHAEESFYAVGQWYEDFRATTDDDVVELLHQAKAEREKARRERAAPAEVEADPSGHPRRVEPARPSHPNVRMPVGERKLEAQLIIPSQPKGLVLFAHGSGSGRHSPRNQFVASELQEAGLATLLLDLLTQEEETIDALDGHLRFDI